MPGAQEGDAAGAVKGAAVDVGDEDGVGEEPAAGAWVGLGVRAVAGMPDGTASDWPSALRIEEQA
ncbi:hypothetical protein ACFVVX_20535 [Kitasatospora sp. NPDC058170]|uniref:hypothetical protein n=1 Tax=Kitasatospora sp. NPDC058170 TaxID=3346364 RepID=UPI0036DC495F